MFNKSNSKNEKGTWDSFLLVCVSFVLILSSNFKGSIRFLPEIDASQKKQLFVAPPSKIEYFSFGFQMTLADSLWIRTIQDFDYCENEVAKNVCAGKSWLFQMLDTLTSLAPDYKIAYKSGALALTVLISDYEGASRIFDKGVRMYPKDSKLLFSAAYHALFEEKDKKKAASLLVQAAHNGGAIWYYNLATRLYSEGGERDLAVQLYRDLEKADVPEAVLKRMKDKIGARYLKEPTK